MGRSTFVALATMMVACSKRGAAEDHVKACEARSAVSCSQNMACRTLYGFAHDPARTCRERASTAIGCVAKEVACVEMTTYAQSPDGRVFELADSCLPAGWTSATGFVRGWPACAQATAAH